MGDIGFLILLILAVVFGIPILVLAVLFSRTARLRSEVDDLRQRLRLLEVERVTPPATTQTSAGSALQPGDRHIQPEDQRLQVGASAPIGPQAASPREVPFPEVQRPATAPIDRPLVPPPSLPPPPLVPPPPPHEPHAPVHQTESLESRIGGRWLLNIGIAAIIIGVAYFEKLAIDNQWIGETARVIQGALLGAALIYAGGRFARRGYQFYGQMLTGGGVAILFVSTYAAFNYYHLIDRPVAFALMVAITALGAYLADHHESQGLAVLAVGGGFLTPFLLPGNTDAQVALFTYVAIMVGGTVFLARRRSWPLLNVVSYVFTLITVAAWADRFYTPEKYLRTEIYLTIFCAMFVAIAWSTRRLDSAFAQFASWFVWTAPFAYYLASQAILAGHPIALLVWFIGVAVVAGVLSATVNTGIGLLIWMAAALPFLAWTLPPSGARLLTPGLVTVASLYAIGLAAQLRTAAERPLGAEDAAWLHLNALMMFAGAYFLLEPAHLAMTGTVGGAFAAWNGLLASFFWSRDHDRAVHFTALALALLSIAIALQFDGPAVTIGWASEGAAIVALGLYERREWMRAAGAALFTVAVFRTLDLLLSDVPASHVVFLNPRAACALLVVALAYGLAWLHRRDPDRSTRAFGIGAGIITAQVVSLVLLTTEIHAFFAIRPAAFTRELMVSVTWAVYATALIIVGLWRRYALVRYFAIALFGITIAKVFFSDLAELERIYRVVSVIGLGITLLLTSYLYQKMRGTLLGNDAAE